MFSVSNRSQLAETRCNTAFELIGEHALINAPSVFFFFFFFFEISEVALISAHDFDLDLIKF